MLRSSERANSEAALIESVLRPLIVELKQTGAYERLKCVELIFVLGWPNREVATIESHRAGGCQSQVLRPAEASGSLRGLRN
ncbi:MAG UNVERIFIED_CONTAM: hypothetical protein LVR18_26660 [Planctomycetaceae bacterium]|jgi:RNA polymerase sigma-70 factor (ECF subfamily)